MLDFVIKNNPYLLECIKIKLSAYLAEDLSSIEIILDFLDELYANIFESVSRLGTEHFSP